MISPLKRLKERIRDSLTHLFGDALLVAQMKAEDRRRLPPECMLSTLPGTQYSRYALPVDYTPSRDYRPRWGRDENHPPIPLLMEWFGRHREDYRAVLADVAAHREALASIALDYDPANPSQPCWRGIALNAIDSAVIYTMVRRFRPKRYLEIGSGASTSFAWKAVKDAGLDTKIISIDPDPRTEIDALCDEVIRDGLETCDIGIFDQLEAGDILFFDGSHRSFMNSDVTVFFIDVLPRIKPGVVIHVHDIALPWDYPEWVQNWYWNEQYLLAVYMMNARERIKLLFPGLFVTRDTAFADWFRTPPVDLGEAYDGWRHGGSMWFTHTA